MTTRHLSLLKPTGRLTLGSYLGALAPMAAKQHGSTSFYGVADLHALTVRHDPGEVRSLVREMKAAFLACGFDPAVSTLFVQSDVPAHSELSYLLECVAHTGELNRMIQFKEKGRSGAETRVSLFTYPALMAADILLYRATEVPVGDDQRQHVELTRDLAVRFNHTYGAVFTVPEITVAPVAARVMDLQEPTAKMAKSRVAGGTVLLLDEPDVVARKISRAVTDSDTGPDAVRHDVAAKPGVSNLLEILSACTGTGLEEAAAGASTYGQLKRQVVDAVLAVLDPIRKRYAELAADPAHVDSVFAAGAERCRLETAPVLAAARAAIGLS